MDPRDPHAVKAMEPDALIEEFRPLVGSIVNRLRREMSLDANQEDLEASGFLGLLEAQHRFDPEHGTLFGTYAYYRIRGKILDECRRSQWGATSRSPSSLARLDAVLERNAEVERVAPRPSSLSDAIDRVSSLVDKAATVYLLSDIDQTVPVAAEQLANMRRAEIVSALREAIATLPKQEQEVVRRHHFEDERMEDIGKALGRSRSWVSRANSRALERLRRFLQEDT